MYSMGDNKNGSSVQSSRNEQHEVNHAKPSKKDDEELVLKSDWMIRPCPVYDAEHWDCMKPKGRFYQYYINGELADCNIWVHLGKECRKWVDDDDVEAAAKIIRHEKEVVERRVQSRIQNDIWVRRDDSERPPLNWNDPLPPHISEKHDGSYLAIHEHELLQPIGIKESWCSIS